MADVQTELRVLLTFLTRDAKVPLAVSIATCKTLRENGLSSPEAIAKSNADVLNPIFNDDKIVKQVRAAAKRVSNPKKRAASGSDGPQVKQPKLADKETQLELPMTDITIDGVSDYVIETNRAPLFLAFALVVAGFIFPDQPLSSRLSLAQGVTSAGAQSKAKYIGLTESTAEDEGWADGQPKVSLMGREIAVMRRHIAVDIKVEPDVDGTVVEDTVATREAFWSIDLEALKKTNAASTAGKANTGLSLPVHRPEAARAYLMKSIDLVESSTDEMEGKAIKAEDTDQLGKSKTTTTKQRMARKEKAVALLLKAVTHVCCSWSNELSQDDLQRKANSWYMKVRPYVEGGQAGWGQRGQVQLRDIIDLARKP